MQIVLSLALLNKYCDDNNYENPYKKICSGNPFQSFFNFIKKCFRK